MRTRNKTVDDKTSLNSQSHEHKHEQVENTFYMHLQIHSIMEYYLSVIRQQAPDKTCILPLG